MSTLNLGEIKGFKALSLEKAVLKPFQGIEDFDGFLDSVERKSKDENFQPVLFIQYDGSWVKLEKSEHFDFSKCNYCFIYRDWVATPVDKGDQQ